MSSPQIESSGTWASFWWTSDEAPPRTDTLDRRALWTGPVSRRVATDFIVDELTPKLELPADLAHAAIELSESGVRELAWARSDALAFLDHLNGKAIPVLGGDVLISPKPLTYAYANWHTDPIPGEDLPTYATRSQRAARDCVERYPPGPAWFIFVLGE